MSLCDRCYNPGQCCQKLSLTGGKASTTESKMRDGTANRRQARRYAVENGVPMFFPLLQVPHDDGRDGFSWRFRCNAVTAEGRCSIYENRPDLCKRYEVGQDDLCVHSHGSEAGDPTADQHPTYLALPVIEDPDAPWLPHDKAAG